jgi:hypothetical protein
MGVFIDSIEKINVSLKMFWSLTTINIRKYSSCAFNWNCHIFCLMLTCICWLSLEGACCEN